MGISARMKLNSFVLFFGLLPIFFSSLNAQMNEKVDSLLAIYNSLPDNERKIRILSNLYDETEFTDPDLAKTYVDKELELAQKLNNIKEIGSAYYNLACYYDNKDHRDSSDYYIKKAKEKYIESNYEHGIMITQHFLAVNDYYDDNYDSALEKLAAVMVTREKRKEYGELAYDYSFKALLFQSKGYYKLALNNFIIGLKILDTIAGREFDKASFLALMAGLEFELENVPKAIEYQEESLKIYKQLDYAKQQAQTENLLASYYTELKDYNRAIAYAEEAVKKGKKIQSQEIEHDGYAELGWAYRNVKEYPKSVRFLKLALEFRKKVDRKADVIRSRIQLGVVYNEINRPDDALFHLNQGLVLADSVNDPKWFQLLYQNRGDAYGKKKQFAKAIEDYKKSNTIKDSLTKINNNREIEELRIIYETEKKEQEINLQKKEIESLEQKAEISNLQRILFGTGLVLSLGILGIGFYGFRQKIKRSKVEKEKVDAELAFKKKELTTHALHLAKKNEVLEGLKQKALELKEKEASNSGYQQLIRTINFDLQDDNNWENFSKYFEQVHKDFNTKVKQKYPDITSNELRLMSLIKMNLSSKEMANMLNISMPGIKKARQRLRKKMGLTTNDSLETAVLSI